MQNFNNINTNQDEEYNLYPQQTEKKEQENLLTNQMFVPLSNEHQNSNTDITKIDAQKQIKDNFAKKGAYPVYEGAEKQNAGLWDTTVDIAKGIGEGLVDGAVVGSWAGLVLDEDSVNLFETQTAAGDFVKTATKYITAGAIALSSGSALGVGVKAAAKYGGKKALGKGARTLLGKRLLYKGEDKVKNVLINKIFNPRHMVAGAYADYTAYSPHEGHLADILKQNGVDNEFVDFMSADINDTVFEAKIKNVFEGILLTPFIGVATDVLLPKTLKAYKALREGTKEANVEKIVESSKQITTHLNQAELVKTVETSIKRGLEEGREPQEIIRELVTDEQYADADFILDNLQKGETVYPNPDGSFSIKIEKWQDGYKVTQAEFNAQLMEGLDENGNWKSETELDKGFKEILEHRGLHQLENEPNEKYFNRIAGEYVKKWQIPKDKKISVEIVDRIANNKPGKTKYEPQKGTIDIKINANTHNKLAALRAELEHARDYAFENFKDKKPGNHFYRYNTPNETEWAKEYLHKKSVAIALENGEDVKPHILNTFNKLNTDKPASLYWKETENKISTGLTHQEKQNQDRLFQLFANAVNMDKTELKKLFTRAAKGNHRAQSLLEDLVDKARESDYFTSSAVFAEHQDLFIDQLGISPKIPVDEVGHNEEMANLVIDSLNNNKFTRDDFNFDEISRMKELEKEEIATATEQKFYEDFYKEINNLTDSTTDLEVLKNKYTDKIVDLETVENNTKEEMLKEVADTINALKESFDTTNKNLAILEENTRLCKDIDKAKTSDDAVNLIGEELTKEGAFSSPEVVKETVEKLVRKIKTRTFDEASEKAVECEKFIAAHISDENFSKDELLKIVKDTFGKSEDVSDRMLAFTEILGKIKAKQDELNQILSNNPNDVSALEKLENLTDSYSYIDKAILNERSQMGRALNEVKLFNKAYRFFVKGDGFERNLTSSQREALEYNTDLFSRTFEEIYEEFFTSNKKPPTGQEISQFIVKRLSAKGKDIDPKMFDPKKLTAFTEHILTSIQGKTPEEQWKLIRKYFRIYNKSEMLLDYLQGAAMTQNITGLHAFKKNFGSNLAHYYIGNILSSPGTQLANALSGAINMAFENTAKTIGGMMTNDKTLFDEAADTVAGYFKYWGESWNFAVQVFKNEQGIIADTRKYGIEVNRYNPLELSQPKPLSRESWGIPENYPLSGIINGLVDGGGAFLRGSGRIMAAADEFLSQLNYRGLAWADAMRTARSELGTGAPVSQIEKYASQLFEDENRYFGKRNDATNYELLYQTRKLIYQNNLNRKIIDPITGNEIKMEDTTWVSNFGNLFEQAKLRVPLFKYVFPFVRTPWNIIEQLLDYTPAVKMTNKYKQLTGRAKAIADAKIWTGSAMIVTSTLLAFNGKITGTPPADDKARKVLMQSGWQPYSFVINNPDGSKSYISYKRVEPLASIIGLGADTANLINTGVMNHEDIGTLIKKVGMCILANAMDKSYLSQGLKIMDLLTISNDADMKKMQSAINNLAGGFLPYSSAVNWWRNESYVRDTRAFLDAMAQRNIFQSNDGVMPSRNYFGEIRPLSNRMTNTLTRVTHQTNDNADKELIRLAQGGATISTPTRMLGNDNEIDLTAFRNEQGQTAYDSLLENMSTLTISGKTLREAVNELVNSDMYQALPDGLNEDEDQLYKSKKKAINALILKYSKKAQKELLRNSEFSNEDGIDINTAYKTWKQSKKYVTLSSELRESF